MELNIKKIITTVILIISCLNTNKANNDSLLINSDSIVIADCIKVKDTFMEELKINKEAINKNKFTTISKVTKTKPISAQPEGFGDFMNNLWDIISSPFKPVWGYYEEDNMRKEGPYFLFMNNYNKLNL